MLGGHLPELLIVLTVALVVFGPKRIPEIGSSLGRGIRDFRMGMSHLGDEAQDRDMHDVVEPRQIPTVVPEHKGT
jgi:sec-independent protein translocase protein TatA